MTEARLTALRQEAQSNNEQVRDAARRILEAEGYTVERLCWSCDKHPAVSYSESGLCEDCYAEMKHRERVAETLPKAKDAIEALHRLADTKAGCEALRQALEMTHRTNQQLVCRAVVALLEKWNEDAKRGPGYYDARNEASVKFAEAVFHNVPERLRYFPYL